tara:strand:+ start:42676 stop:43959 length:1284 start_codon:yes stop_codon:yes gene_type:complete
VEKLIIEGGGRLTGSVEISGSKNSSLPIIAATALHGGTYKIKNVPNISDVKTMLLLLEKLGAGFSFNSGTVEINTEKIHSWEAPYDLVKTMRASVVIWGALLGRFGRAKISLPGGCAIGDRPVDQHLKGFEALGYKTDIVSGYLESASAVSTGGSYNFEVVTVTGTENLILASILSNSPTELNNCSIEPEVLDLIKFLTSLGAKIDLYGNSISIEPVSSLGKQVHPHYVIPDRIEAGTFMALGCMPGNEITITNCDPAEMDAPCAMLERMGAVVSTYDKSRAEGPSVFKLKVVPPDRVGPLEIETSPHPGFPTDLQAQFMALLCLASGTSKITENIFPNRFIHAAELRKLGAKINLEANVATILGVDSLTGAKMQASDLRASASLLIGALAAKGKSEIYRIYHLDRGYESIDNKLKEIGGKVWREKE